MLCAVSCASGERWASEAPLVMVAEVAVEKRRMCVLVQAFVRRCDVLLLGRGNVWRKGTDGAEYGRSIAHEHSFGKKMGKV